MDPTMAVALETTAERREICSDSSASSPSTSPCERCIDRARMDAVRSAVKSEGRSVWDGYGPLA